MTFWDDPQNYDTYDTPMCHKLTPRVPFCNQAWLQEEVDPSDSKLQPGLLVARRNWPHGFLIATRLVGCKKKLTPWIPNLFAILNPIGQLLATSLVAFGFQGVKFFQPYWLQFESEESTLWSLEAVSATKKTALRRPPELFQLLPEISKTWGVRCWRSYENN